MSYRIEPTAIFEREAKRLTRKYRSLKSELVELADSLKANVSAAEVRRLLGVRHSVAHALACASIVGASQNLLHTKSALRLLKPILPKVCRIIDISHASFFFWLVHSFCA